ncbi:hypothetical protein [Candidatus Methylobacter oryzae]|uniref:Uncharacterized protein n=1 Tax=Candidatus Methylobacter oryzae TaxID=2497749 RepID=A0ABY3CEW2_9GAMM|nr:hypothetical protein [Candidatus Methylobacter oryzae]TRX01915.1 hypothetical protein EKO24_003170 [Candidatus Methylobacter oryzae]
MFTTIVSTARRVIYTNAELSKASTAERDAIWRIFSASYTKNITGFTQPHSPTMPLQVDIQLVITEIHKGNHTPVPLPNIPAISPIVGNGSKM